MDILLLMLRNGLGQDFQGQPIHNIIKRGLFIYFYNLKSVKLNEELE